MARQTERRGTALITGASSGIGEALAHVFAANGHNVIMVAEDAPGLENAAKRLRESFPDVEALAMVEDLSTTEGANSLYAALRRQEVEVDYLCNNAGVGVYGAFMHETPLDAEEKMIHLNAIAPVRLSKLFGNDMVRRGRGRILFTASVVSVAPQANLLVYSATKAFLYNFALGLREELKDTGVTVTALMPGATDTGFFRRAGMEDTKTANGDLDDPMHVAEVGYNALMRGDDHEVASLGNKLQVLMGKMMPDGLTAGRAE